MTNGLTDELPQPAAIDHVIIMEEIAAGERVRAYQVEGLASDNTWKPLCDGTHAEIGFEA